MERFGKGDHKLGIFCCCLNVMSGVNFAILPISAAITNEFMNNRSTTGKKVMLYANLNEVYLAGTPAQ